MGKVCTVVVLRKVKIISCFPFHIVIFITILGLVNRISCRHHYIRNFVSNLTLTTLDISIMVLYAVAIIGYGLYHAKRSSSEDYFLAGRNMTWPIVGISLFAANISSSTLVGLAGDAFKTNTHVFNYEWLAVVVLIFFAVFFLPFYLKSKVYTMPEFLERRYDRRSRYYFSFITIVGNVLLDTAAGLYVGMIILRLMFPGMEAWMIVSLLAIAAAAYTVPGGLNSVIQTEVVQAILLIFGSCLLTYFAFGKVGGWSGLLDGLDSMGAAGAFADKGVSNADEILSMWRPTGDGWRNFLLGTGGDEFMPWTGLVFGAPILGFYFWANNQFMVQRVLGARNVNHGRWGALFGGLLKLPVLLIMVIPGTIAILLYSNMDISGINYIAADGSICQNLRDCPNATYPILLFDLLPRGILGLVLAGLLAAMMSSISATFNSASTLVTMDFIRNFRPDMGSKQLVRAGQVVTLVLVIAATMWAPFIERFDSLWVYLQDVLAYIAPPVAATFILGLFWKGATGTGSIASLLVGFLLTIIAILSVQFEWIGWLNEMHFLHRTFYLFILCMMVHVVVSLNSASATQEQIRDYTWSRSIFQTETAEMKSLPWYQNYRILALILLTITALIVGQFM
jgi:solute:Na+ symporter, SSS family